MVSRENYKYCLTAILMSAPNDVSYKVLVTQKSLRGKKIPCRTCVARETGKGAPCWCGAGGGERGMVTVTAPNSSGTIHHRSAASRTAVAAG